MSDLIDRQEAIDALVKAIREDPYYDSNEAINGLSVCDVRVILNELPTAEPKKGKCKEVYDCEMCDFYMTEDSLFVCPKSSNCGADMRGEENETD